MIVTDRIQEINARAIVGTLRPSGRFSVCQTFRRKHSSVKSKEIQREKNTEVCDVQYIDFVYKSILDGSWFGLQPVSQLNQSQRATLGLSIGTNSNTPSARGSKGITARQRDVLCWSANALEKAYFRRNMSFLTLTLPELTIADLKSVQGHWSEIVHTVLIYLQREFKRYGLVTHIVGCTEIQLERKERTGLSYPHLHLVFRGRFHGRAGWVVSPRKFRDIWRRCVSRFLSNGCYSWESSENVQQVNKSCGGYLAKYISKASSKDGDGSGDTWHPSDWVVCSRTLRRLYEQLTRKSADLGQVLLTVVREWVPGLGYKRPIVIQTAAYGDREIGHWGWLKGEETYPDFGMMHSG